MRSPSPLKFIVLMAFMLLSVAVFGQPGGDPGGDPDVPITGIELLLGGGALLGLKKILKSRKERS